MAIKAVIFDCFGVLYVDPTAFFYRLAQQNNSPAQTEQFSDLLKQTNRGIMTESELFTRTATLFSMPTTEVAEILTKGVARNTELIEYLKALKGQYKIGLLSNISRGTMDQFFPKSERQALFDHVILSGDVGIIKPAREIYQLAAQEFLLEPSEIVFIDDNEANCVGAISAGMKAIHHTTNQNTFSDLRNILSM